MVGIAYDQFNIEVTQDGVNFCKAKNEITYGIRNGLRRIFLNEIKNKNRTVKQKAQILSAINPQAIEQFKKRILPKIIDKCVGSQSGVYQIQIDYFHWKELKYSNRRSPDYQVAVFNSEVRVP